MKSKYNNPEDISNNNPSVIKVDFKDTEDAKEQIKLLKIENDNLTKKLADTKKTYC